MYICLSTKNNQRMYSINQSRTSNMDCLPLEDNISNLQIILIIHRKKNISEIYV